MQTETTEQPQPIVEPNPLAIVVARAKYAARAALAADKEIVDAEFQVLPEAA